MIPEPAERANPLTYQLAHARTDSRAALQERLSLEYYLTKSYCKTASLMAYSCKSAALLSDHALDSDVVIAAEKFGYHFGLAFQAQ